MDHISFRNLTEGDFLGTPLREFKGHLEALEPEYNEEWKRTYIHFKFTEVEVISSQEPYDLPIADVRMPYSSRRQSGWGVLASSAVKLLPENMDVRDTVGTVQHWKVTGGHMLWDSRTKAEVDRQCWEVLSIEGAGQVKVDAMQRAKELLDGKTLQQFQSAALSDAVIRSDASVQQAILGRTLVQQLVESGEVVVDADGIHYVKMV